MFYFYFFKLEFILRFKKLHALNYDDIVSKKSESLQTEGRHFRSMICKLSDV